MPNAAQTIPAVYAYSGFDGIDYTNPGPAAVSPGSVVDLGNAHYGIARQLIPALVVGTLGITGIFDVLQDGASTFDPGDTVYFNANTNTATSSGSYSGDVLGIATEHTETTDVSVRVFLTSWYNPT